MQIKLIITGELEEYIKQRAESEFRSPTQQAHYMLMQAYKMELEMERNISSQILLTQNQCQMNAISNTVNNTALTNMQAGVNVPQVEPSYVTGSSTEDNNDDNKKEEEEIETDYIPDDVADF